MVNAKFAFVLLLLGGCTEVNWIHQPQDARNLHAGIKYFDGRKTPFPDGDGWPVDTGPGEDNSGRPTVRY